MGIMCIWNLHSQCTFNEVAGKHVFLRKNLQNEKTFLLRIHLISFSALYWNLYQADLSCNVIDSEQSADIREITDDLLSFAVCKFCKKHDWVLISNEFRVIEPFWWLFLRKKD